MIAACGGPPLGSDGGILVLYGPPHLADCDTVCVADAGIPQDGVECELSNGTFALCCPPGITTTSAFCEGADAGPEPDAGADGGTDGGN
jgi:hypothetical protein